MKEQSIVPKTGAQHGGGTNRASGHDDVQSITNAAQAHSEEMRGRMIKYATAMGIRMVCIVAIFFVDGWFKLIPIIGAVLLPWVAVVIANGGADITKRDQVTLLDEAPHEALSAPPVADPAPGDTVLTGEYVLNGEYVVNGESTPDATEARYYPEEKSP